MPRYSARWVGEVTYAKNGFEISFLKNRDDIADLTEAFEQLYEDSEAKSPKTLLDKLIWHFFKYVAHALI